jgi:hypothetical protein
MYLMKLLKVRKTQNYHEKILDANTDVADSLVIGYKEKVGITGTSSNHLSSLEQCQQQQARGCWISKPLIGIQETCETHPSTAI